MSDNIRNFNDYRKKVNLEKQQTEEIDIKIQDPLDFLTENERQQYYRTQQERMDEEREKLDKQSPDFYLDDENEPEEILPEEGEPKKRLIREHADEIYRKEDNNKDIEKSTGNKKDREERKRSEQSRKNIKQKNIKESKKKDSTREDEDWSEEDEGGIDPYLIVRISSIVTGLIILILIAVIVKVKVIDTIFVQDPDEAQTVEIGEVEGYTGTEDTVVTTVQLNLRSTPSTESDSFIVTSVPTGTELKRISVSDDGVWAQVEYEGQILYCAMKYLTVKS